MLVSAWPLSIRVPALHVRAVPAEDPADGVDGAAERRGGARDGGQARGVGAGEGRLGGDRDRGEKVVPFQVRTAPLLSTMTQKAVEAQETELSWPWVSMSLGWVQRAGR